MTERRVLNGDETQIRNELQKLSDLVLKTIDNVCEALVNLDVPLCEKIIANDQTVNDQYHKIEKDCFTAIATQQPVAIDLRVLTAALHIGIELERIGDYVAGIADTIIKIAKEEPIAIVDDVLQMMAQCKEMLNQAVLAYTGDNSEAALSAAQQDFEIDKLQAQLSNNIITQMSKSPSQIPFGARLLWIVHNIERIGDRATNICEQIVYIHQGTYPDLNP